MPKSITNIVFSKLDGLFSDNGNLAYTTESRINAIKYPFQAFLSSPFIGIGYDSFSYLNKYICDGLAVNTILNWFACMGLLFGVPCTVCYLITIKKISKLIDLSIIPTILLLLASILMVSTESLLRISFIYVIIFYGCKKNNRFII